MNGSPASAARRTTYEETFDDGCGGWYAWKPNGSLVPEVRDGVYHERSPWWVDSNHAPPAGAGYLHLLAILWTQADQVPEHRWPNRFIEGGYSRDLTDALVTLRVRGDLRLGDARLSVLVQARLPDTTANFVLVGQTFEVTPEWAERQVVLRSDPSDWLCLGARADLSHLYGCGEIADVLCDVNLDLILVLFPLPVRPVAPLAEVIHGVRRQSAFDVDWTALPEGWVEIDTIRVEYPESRA
jgi:hypothetical protein